MTKTKKLKSLYLRRNFTLAWPLALNALLMQSMLVIDIYLVSPLGEISLAAMGIATTLIAFFLGLQFAIGNGLQLIIGRAFGAKDKHRLTQVLINGLLINFTSTLFFIASLVIWSDNFVNVLTSDPSLAKYVHEYLSIAQYILLVNSITQTLIVFLNGQGNTRIPFRIYLIELPFNAVVSYFLIFGVADFAFNGIGLPGAAFGSLAAIILRFCILLNYILKHSTLIKPKISKQLNQNDIISQVKEILPIATNYVVLSVGITVYQLLFSQLELSSYVAVTIVFPWLRIATQFIVAWAQANSITITQAIGRKKTSHIQLIISNCIQLGFVMALVLAFLLYFLSLSLESMNPDVEPQVLLALASIAPLYIAIPIIRTFNTIAGNSLRAMGKSVEVLKIHTITQWFIALPVCAIFILYLELPLFWAFALIPMEELLKVLPFFLLLKKSRLTPSQA